MSVNDKLRLLREQLNLSIQDVADGAGISFRTVLRAEQGLPLNPESRRQLCRFFGKSSEELGLVPRCGRTKERRSDDCTDTSTGLFLQQEGLVMQEELISYITKDGI